jgi:hypothetical protein
VTTLTHPGAVVQRLEELDAALALHQNDLEQAAQDHFTSKHLKEKAKAEAFLKAQGERTIAERTAIAERDTAVIGMEHEARWEGLKGVVRVLDTRSAIGMSILRAQSRVGA